MATRNNLIEQIDVKHRVPSTAYAFGGFLKSNGAGEVLPLTATVPVLGLGLQEITASDPFYAVEQDYPYDGINKTIDRFLVQVEGTATSEMEGLSFDIGSTASIISVGSSGTQFRMERFISATLCEFSVQLTAADAT